VAIEHDLQPSKQQIPFSVVELIGLFVVPLQAVIDMH